MLIEQVIEFELRALGSLTISVARRSGNPTLMKMLSMTKMWQKTIVSSVSVSFSIFRVQNFLLAFVNNIGDQGLRAPLNSIFANQFTLEKLHYSGEIENFFPKICYLRPLSDLFMDVTQ